MRESIAMRMIDGQTYLATPRGKRSALLPTTPGIYIWTLQLNRVLDGIASGDELIDRFAKPFQQVRTERREFGTAGLFKEVHVIDSPPLLTPKSVERMSKLMSAGHSDFSWIAMMATLFQRPLYIGKAIDFRKRIPLHFNYRTSFSEQIQEMKISMSDLAVTLFSLDWASDYEMDDDGEGEEAQESTEEESEEEFVPPGRTDQDMFIRLAESLLIRQLQPIFNQQVE